MRRVFTAAQIGEAIRIQELLESQGLTVELRGEALDGLREQLGLEARPSLWVPDEKSAAQAERIVEEFEAGVEALKDQPPWNCHACGEESEALFTACWSCGAERQAPERH